MALIKYFVILLLVYPGIACSKDPEKMTLPAFTDIKVISAGSDESNAFCQNFRLTEEQANIFFKKSRVIDITLLHDAYDFLPCYVRGTSRLKSTHCTWEIRAGSTAEVQCNTNNYILACDTCDDLFKDE